MIRRVLAMLFVLTFWSIQTADAGVLHIGSDATAVSILANHVQVSGEATDSDSDKSESDVPATCTDGCPCHAFHHGFYPMAASEANIRVASRVYSYSQDGRPDHLSAPLNRPPLS